MNNTSIAYKTGFGVMAAFMLLASVPLAFVNFGSLLPHYFSAFICAVATIASGPIAGWITVMIRGGECLKAHGGVLFYLPSFRMCRY
jgi:hypothetical protein